MGKQRFDKKEKKEEEGPKEKKPRRKEIRKTGHVMRFVETNIDGSKPVRVAIMEISGAGFAYSNAIEKVSGFEGRILSELNETELKKLEDVMMNPQNYGIPPWVYNRRRDPQTGEIRHIMVSQLQFAKRMDINELRKIKSYKGMRHSWGLPVRGQRTRGSFRKGKTMGVAKKKKGK